MNNNTSISELSLCWNTQDCWDTDETLEQTVLASRAFVYQFIIGLILIISPSIMKHFWPHRLVGRLGFTIIGTHFILALIRWIRRSIIAIIKKKTRPRFILISETGLHRRFIKASRDNAVFFTHTRTEANFQSKNTEEHVKPPVPSGPCRERMTVKHWSCFRILGMGMTFDFALGLALIAGSLGSLIIVFNNYATYTESNGDEGDMRIYINSLYLVASSLINNFKFFPIFLLFGYLGYSVTLWRRFVEQGTLIQGRLHDVCILVGGAVIDPTDEKTRKSLYRIYRYITVAHFLCYSSLSESLSKKSLSDLMVHGLLLQNEVNILEQSGNKTRDTLCGWLSLEIQSGLRNNRLDTTANAPLINSIARFRGYMGQLHDFKDFSNPNIWASNMMLVVNTNIILLTLGMPWTLYIPSTTMYVPWITTLAVYVSCLSYLTTMEMIIRLENCFEGEDDIINIDAFIAGSEQTAFALLRVGFDDDKRVVTGSV